MKLRQRRWTVARLDGIATGRLKCCAEHQANTWLVVDNQDRRGGVHGLPLFELPHSGISDEATGARSVPDSWSAIQDTHHQKVTSMSLDDPTPVRSRYAVRI